MSVSIHLEHSAVTEVYKSRIFENVNTFSNLIHAINTHALARFPLLENEADNDDIRNERNDLKGRFFEVFVEFLLNATHLDNRVGIHNVKPNEATDLGVDFTGTGHDGKAAVVQAKFRSNIKQVLTYRELSTFGNDALARYHIISESSAEATRQQLHAAGVLPEIYNIVTSTMHNMVVVSTTLEAYYHWETVNKGSQFIGYNEINRLVHGMPNFWKDFRRSLEQSALKPTKRQHRQLWKRIQVPVKEAIIEFLKSDSQKRGQVIVGTGGGKTTSAAEAVADSIRIRNSLIHIVMTPRIALTQQLLREFHDYKPDDVVWNLECVCSGDKEQLEFYDDTNIPSEVQPTCRLEEVESWIAQALLTKTPLVIFSTYHSVKKIRGALCRNKTVADLAVCDEAHNLVNYFKKVLDLTSDESFTARKWLFFTATRKVDYSGQGRGMNNEDLFGKIIEKIVPRTLIEEGRIVPPRIHLVHYDPNKYIDEHSDERVRDNIAMIVAGIKEHKKRNPETSRVIVFCGDAANEPKGYMNNKIIQRELSEFYMGAVTSEYTYELMPGQTLRRQASRQEIFQRFAEYKFSILFHYDVVSEGIDFPGATGKLPLRVLGNIKVVQGAGRTVRVCPEDRKRLEAGLIKVGDVTGWKKPFGWVIIPYVSRNNEDDAERLMEIIRSLRDEQFDIDLETIDGVIDRPDTRTGDDGLDPKNPERHDPTEGWTSADVKEVIQKIRHEIEPKSKAIVKPRVRKSIDQVNNCSL